MKNFVWLFLIIVSLSKVNAYNIVVAIDGTGDVNTVQEAFDKAPDNSNAAYVIFVKKGIYKQKLSLISTKKTYH